MGEGNIDSFHFMKIFLFLTQAYALGLSITGLVFDSSPAVTLLAVIAFSVSFSCSALLCTTIGLPVNFFCALPKCCASQVLFSADVSFLVEKINEAVSNFSHEEKRLGTPPTSWTSICSDALGESLGSTSWLPLAKTVSFSCGEKVHSVSGILMGWTMLPHGLLPPREKNKSST